ncbi:MAG: cysteine peptidase family C39 domain-containing protein [Planctomycetota bacterium]
MFHPSFLCSLLVAAVGAVIGWRLGVSAGERDGVTLENVQRRVAWIAPSALSYIAVLLGCLAVLLPRVSIEWVPALLLVTVEDALWIVSLAALTVFLAFAATLSRRTEHERKDMLSVLAPVVPLILLWFIAQSNIPIYDRLKHREKEGVLLQSSSSSCAAATLANLLRTPERPLTEREVAQQLGTTRRGTSIPHIVLGLDHYGQEHRVSTRRTIDALTTPAILFVDHPVTGKESHAVALVDRREEAFVIWDPLIGETVLSEDDLRRLWHGYVVELVPPNAG